MAINITTLDVLQARVYATLGGQTAINVLHFECVLHGGLGGTLQQCASAFDALISTSFKALLSSSASYRGVGMKRLRPGAPTVEEYAVLGSGAGTVTGDVLPKQCCGLIAKRTDFAGPSARGRFYMPFPGEADNDADSTPSSTYMTRLASLAANLILGFNAGLGADMSTLDLVLSRNVPLSTTPITSMLTREKWATQRSRGDFGRPNASPI